MHVLHLMQKNWRYMLLNLDFMASPEANILHGFRELLCTGLIIYKVQYDFICWVVLSMVDPIL